MFQSRLRSAETSQNAVSGLEGTSPTWRLYVKMEERQRSHGRLSSSSEEGSFQNGTAESSSIATAVMQTRERQIALKARPSQQFIVECRVMDLTGLLRRSEGKTLEYKRGLSSPEGVLRTFVAFANTAGGTLLVGVEEGPREFAAFKMSLEQRRK